ncbi:MAG: hypothetical protein K2W96_23990 [Gemmataceae bacterium]|nr:hypothetical protein [Gemmataceae bacterium]
MAYSDFTLEMVRERFGVDLREDDLFPALAPVEPNAWLQETLALRTPLMLQSEKGRCESIVYPVLATARVLGGSRLAVYSGQTMNVDPAAGLAGECDFILGVGPALPPLRAPLLAVVEAKRADIEDGMGQCVAQMIGARRFNDNAGRTASPVFGCVTTGEAWQFLKLEPDAAVQHPRRLFLNELPLILGALLAIQAAALGPLPAARP